MTDAERSLAGAIAGGVIAAALLQTLRDKGILSLAEARGVLERAFRALHTFTPEEGSAKRLIGDMLRDQYPAERG